MSTDSTPNEDGEQIDKVADRVIDRLQERDDVDLSRIESKAIDISRRQILGAAAAAGLGGVIGSAGTARAAGEDFTNSSGTVGTDDQPLSEVNVQNLHGESGTLQLRDLTDSFVLLESRMVGPGTGDSNSNQHSVVFSGIRTVIEGHTYDWAIDALDGGADMTTQTQVNAHEIFIGGQNQP